MSEDRDSVRERVGNRFETGEQNDQNEQSDQSEGNAQSSKSSQNDGTSQNAKNKNQVKNVKNAWTAVSVYLDDDIHGRLGRQYKQLDLDLDEERNEFKKTRHYYPLLVSAGLDALENMDTEQIVERLDEVEPDG